MEEMKRHRQRLADANSDNKGREISGAVGTMQRPAGSKKK